MSELIALPPTAAEIAAGELTVPLHYSGPDTAPVPMSSSGPDEVGYHVRQDVRSDRWKVTHSLGRYPNVTVQANVYAEAIVVTEGTVEHHDTNRLDLRFGEPVSGIAWLR